MKLQVPKGCGGVSFEGQFYAAQKGVVEVPDHAAVFMEPGWGFTLIPGAPEPKESKK